MKRPKEKNPAIYRHFDAQGRLLYVGATACPLVRTGEHKQLSPWFPQVRTVTIDYTGSIEEARALEGRAIETERPVWNQTHNRKKVAGCPKQHIPLSEQQLQVLKLLDAGKSITQVAAEMQISVKTASTHRTRIAEKLEMKSPTTVALVAKAYSFGLCGENA